MTVDIERLKNTFREFAEYCLCGARNPIPIQDPSTKQITLKCLNTNKETD